MSMEGFVQWRFSTDMVGLTSHINWRTVARRSTYSSRGRRDLEALPDASRDDTGASLCGGESVPGTTSVAGASASSPAEPVVSTLPKDLQDKAEAEAEVLWSVWARQWTNKGGAWKAASSCTCAVGRTTFQTRRSRSGQEAWRRVLEVAAAAWLLRTLKWRHRSEMDAWLKIALLIAQYFPPDGRVTSGPFGKANGTLFAKGRWTESRERQA